MDLQVRPLTSALGAQVSGVDLRTDLDSATVDAIRRAWLEHLVLVFPGQDITPQQQIRFTRQLGLVEEYPLVPYRLPGFPEIFLLTNMNADGTVSQTANNARHWHSDLSFTSKPAMGSMLRCVQIPQVGGTTAFANQYLAYEGLSPAFREMIEPLQSVHELFSKNKNKEDLDQGQVRDMKMQNPRIAQPVVRVHDETGRKALYVSEALSTDIVGMSREESDLILNYLFKQQTRMEFTYRHAWKQHDIVLWDNRCTLHMAVADHQHAEPRVMYRTTLVGEPCGRVVA